MKERETAAADLQRSGYKKEEKWTDQHDEDQQQTEKGLTIGHLECTITVQTRRPSYYD
jgi:hypothetical protein